MAFNSTEIELVPYVGQTDFGDKWGCILDLSSTPLGRSKGYDPHALRRVLFHFEWYKEAIEALVMAMVYTADVELWGLKKANQALVMTEYRKFCALVDKALDFYGDMEP